MGFRVSCLGFRVEGLVTGEGFTIVLLDFGPWGFVGSHMFLV